jgi:tetratricopeptide (TPR) repeat protein
MGTNLHNSYVFKALDAYPYNLEEALEALNYALSYNPKDVHALCLMGRLYAEQLKDYATAKQYYVEALSENIEAHYIYPYYVETLLWNDDVEEAEKLIDFALTIKGTDKGLLLLKKGQLYEATENYELALATLKEAKKGGLNNGFVDYVANEISRVKKKVKSIKKKKKKKDKSVKKKAKTFFGLM